MPDGLGRRMTRSAIRWQDTAAAMNDYDVAIVGGGGAGMAAALAAASAGARTLLVEADRKLGGTTALSGGVVYAAGTSVQRARGIVDSAGAIFEYYMSVNPGLDADVIRRLCSESGPTIEWLIDLGIDFPPEQLYAAGLDGALRGHRASGRGEALTEVLDSHVSNSDLIDVALGTRCEGLVLTGGQVRGIAAAGADVAVGAVVLASGGFGADPGLVKAHIPTSAQYAADLWYLGSAFSRGDGLRMGLDAGGEVAGTDTVAALLSPGFTRDFEPLLPGWVVLVDRDGDRFIDENQGYEIAGETVRRLPGGECYAIFDERARTEATLVPPEQGPDRPSWKAETLAQMADRGIVRRASSLEELARATGITEDRLAATISSYNEDCAAGSDSAFGKKQSMLLPVCIPPFYAVRIRPIVIGITGAGLRINASTQVIAARSACPIAGLFAAGEQVGGVLGHVYVGGGASLANAFTFGRIAGQEAARCSSSRLDSCRAAG